MKNTFSLWGILYMFSFYSHSHENGVRKDIAFQIENRLHLFACLGFIVLLENFSPIWRRQRYRWRAANFDLYSAFMVIEQWGFFSVPHILLYGLSFWNGHLRWPVTLTPIAERLAAELSLPVFTTKVCCGWDSNTQP